MKPVLSTNIVFRAPKFSWVCDLKDCWETLKLDISIASPSFYEHIKDVSFDEYDQLNSKIKFTVWKYFNRSRFRATPFGTFSGFGLVKGNYDNNLSPVRVKIPFKKHSFINWPCKSEIKEDVASQLKGDPFLFCNTTYYLTNSTIRYVATNDKEFELAEIGYDEQVVRILTLTQQPLLKSDLINQLGIKDSELAEFEVLLSDMVELQMIFTEGEPNIIGEDYFRRRNVYSLNDPTPYVISEIQIKEGNINMTLFKHIPSLIDVLQRNVPKPNSGPLEQFKSKFLSKFDQNEVPIMLALDPEMGVGYDELEQANKSSDFAAKLKYKQSPTNNASNHEIKDSLLKFTNFKPDYNCSINLEDLVNVNKNEVAPLPNSLSVVVQVIDDKVFIENIGGSTANALNGRFTLGSDVLLEQCRALARQEGVANPDVLFFDVAYMSEANVDNINRRSAIYEYQLSILNYDLSEQPLSLNDILISVKEGELVLRSRKLNKRLIPRLATAYNYSRSDLSIFRLLCDLQYHGIHVSLLPDPDALLPNKEYYPRIEYKNLIVSAAKWRINSKELPKELNMLNDYFDSRGIPDRFKCGVSDQTLCFDRRVESDRVAFLNYTSKLDNVLLEEFLIPENSSIITELNEPIVAQYILTAAHTNTIYRGLQKKDPVVFNEVGVKEQFSPGSEWLYFEIYCHHQRADSILAGPISSLLEESKDLIDKWFFIRYNENGDHLRVRFKLKSLEYYHEMVMLMNQFLNDYVDNGLISDVQIKTYKRELARYGVGLIEDVETHFCVDSSFILNNLLHLHDDMSKYWHAIRLAKIILNTVFEDKEKIYIAKSYSDAFIAEHNLESQDFKLLNQQYQEYLSFSRDYTSNCDLSIPEQSFVNVLKASLDSGQNIFGDLFHMHVNRLFPDLQRTHELIIYYFLLKDLQREKAIK